MKLSTLRRSGSKALPGITAPARVDRRTRNLVTRIGPGEIAVIDHLDIDRASAVALSEAGVAAVVNAAPSISGRYPNLGPLHLIDAGIVVIDDVGGEIFGTLHDGEVIRVDGDSVYVGEELVTSGTRLDRASVLAAMEASRDGIPSRLEALSANAVEQLRLERDLLLDGTGVPRLTTPTEHRQVVVVVRAFDYRQDLAGLKRFIKECSPVLLGVDAGADALIAAGYRPDVIVCSGDDVSEAALRSGAEVVLKAGHDGRVDPSERVERLGVRHITFPTNLPAADAALLLAHVNDASLIVTVGTPAGLGEFLDTGRSSMASSVLTRAAVGSRVADAKAVSQLYRPRIRGWLLMLGLLLALVAVGAAIATTPVGQDWWQQIQDWWQQAVDWARGLGN